MGAINGHLSSESQNWQKKLTILGSGGVRNSLDIVQRTRFRCQKHGVAGTILASLMSKNGLENTLALVQQWQEEVKMLYTFLGKKTTEELTSTALILDPVLVNCVTTVVSTALFSQNVKETRTLMFWSFYLSSFILHKHLR